MLHIIQERYQQKKKLNLKRSIKEFGFIQPLIWNEKTGHVVGGNQRLMVLKEMGIPEVEVVVVNLDLEKEKALNIALNKISGDWDKRKLEEILREIDLELSLISFDKEELDKILKVEEKEEPEFKYTPELYEAHNYVVLYFDNIFDWQVAMHKLGLEPVHSLDSRPGYVQKGIGRVIRGADVIARLKDD